MTTTCPHATAASTFDPFAEDYLQDPYPHLRAVRHDRPVFYSRELDYWVVTRYADVQACFGDQDRCSAAIALDPLLAPRSSTLSIMAAHGFAPGPSLVNEDPPLHHLRRKRLQRAFSPQRMKALEPFVRDIARRYVDTFVKRGHADLVADVFYELPAMVVFKFFGVPDQDVETVKAYAGPLSLFIWGHPDETEQNRLARMMGAYYEYSRAHIRRLVAEPLAAIADNDYIQAHLEDPELFPEEYVAGLLPNFLYAGHETTTSQAGNALRILLEHREQWDALCADLRLVPNAVEECLRAVSSVIAWRRRTRAPLELHGVTIPADANVLIYNGSANHDEAVFADGEAFDIRRENARRHISFGYGAHLCLGAPLARLELKVILEELSRRLPHMRLRPGQPWSYSANTSFRGPRSVLVDWDPADNPLAADKP